MRMLLIDIDSLRADRLGCYGYHRNTSPTIDMLARDGVRLENCYVSDAPCCPSRTSMFSAQYGYQHGCVNHKGSRAERWPNPQRGFVDSRDVASWPSVLRKAGHRCAFLSSFPTRHCAWHALAGFDEWIDTGGKGHELAPTVFQEADQWLQSHGQENDWYCHVTFWDAHTPYRTPADYGEPFAGDPLPAWPDEGAVLQHAQESGLRSAMDSGWSKGHGPRQPHPVDSLDSLRGFQNGYDTGLRYIDDHIAKLLERLNQLGILEETAIIVTADHGEDMGELGAYGAHCFCGPAVARVPMIIKWPGAESGVLTGLHQHFDLAATICDRLGIDQPDRWSARSFLPAIEKDPGMGRDFVVSSMLAQGIQRAVYWRESPTEAPTCYLRTWNGAAHPVPKECIIGPENPYFLNPHVNDRLDRGRSLLTRWAAEQAALSPHLDPLETVLVEGTDVTNRIDDRYRQRLHDTGRTLSV